MGKILEMDKDRKLRVTGIAKDVPANSHLDFDLVTPISFLFQFDFWKVWINNNHFEYALLDEHADPRKIVSRFPAFMDKYTGSMAKETGYKFSLGLMALKDVYFEGGVGL